MLINCIDMYVLVSKYVEILVLKNFKMRILMIE